LITLVRPLNVLITAIAVFIGALLTGTIEPFNKVLLAVFSAATICAGGNILNDYFDVDIDRINKPSRPIPSGNVNKKVAFTISIVTIILGLILSMFINTVAIFIAFLAVIFMVSYNTRLKRRGGIIGNTVITITATLPLFYGSVSVGRIKNIFFPALFAFLLHLGREIIKDIEDITGDYHAKSNSLPVRCGLQNAYYIAFIPLFLLIIISPVPFIMGIFNLYYLIIIIPFVILPLIFSFFFFRKKLNPNYIGKLSTILKLAMVFGLLSLIIGIL
jgi:geranylgeranylglycerol-phosphate geranylgeranyltransferase